MMSIARTVNSQALKTLEQAVAAGKLTPEAAENICKWLSESRYSEYANQVAEHLNAGQWKQLDDVFWTVIPFGTGGRRGKMYPIGTNAINDRTIGESAQGLVDYVKRSLGNEVPLACAIAYDTRHQSEHFARLCAEIMVAAGFTVYFLQGYRSTPELSFTVRYKNCSCGIMVTASHNPPSDNAVKAYWSTGGQLLPPHDRGVIDCVMNTQEIRRANFEDAVARGQILLCQDEVDVAFQNAVLRQANPGPRKLKIIYSPLHGVGSSAVLPVLQGDGFSDVEVFAPHAQPDGDFPNVPGHVSNPENPEVFTAIIERAKVVGADLVMATDADCDRIGAAAPLTADVGSEWATLTGNQISALMADFVLNARNRTERLSPQHYLVTTLVTTQMLRRIAESYGVRTFDNLLVGFKWIAGVIDDQGPKSFIFGTEEAHGYLAGTHVRDKDGAVAAMLLCELAAELKANGQTLHQKLDALYLQHGAHAEKTVSIQMPGSEGMTRMKEAMARFRNEPPREIAGLPVTEIRDYLRQTVTQLGGQPQPFAGPTSDLLILQLIPKGNYVAVRPSGTEPKIKFYGFAFEPPERIFDLDRIKQTLATRLEEMTAYLCSFAKG